ncbi:MAG TPA: NrdH-redoxin [Opitutae bacterium]|nr:NrdH-redoxin [Opitutae bacterium]|tara:strand:- start:679 stop:984 length:306 start_codon:yes stop_codon:yes gene_type:complete
MNLTLTNAMKKKPILYVKDGCPWCEEALSFFSQHGVPLDIRDVRGNKKLMEELIEVSEQSKVPTFAYDDFIVADFSINEFLDELDQVPEVRLELGIGEDED